MEKLEILGKLQIAVQKNSRWNFFGVEGERNALGSICVMSFNLNSNLKSGILILVTSVNYDDLLMKGGIIAFKQIDIEANNIKFTFEDGTFIVRNSSEFCSETPVNITLHRK